MFTDRKIPSDLLLAKKLVYDPDYILQEFVAEYESQEYGACMYKLNGRRIKFRVAKTTPAKTGQFVTLWKRNDSGITEPHDSSDPFDLFVISVRKDHLFGQFVFTKAVLIKQGILTTSEKEGKRGFRVYPPWDTTENKQAQKTQHWQSDFFLEINNGNPPESGRIKLLYTG